MTRTFLVAIEFSDELTPDPVADAQEIEDALVGAGIDVASVKMWMAPAAAAQPIQPL